MLIRALLCLFVAIFYALSANACDSEITCIKKEEWSLGIAIGAGARTNPLVDGDPIPLIVLPDIAWYGENTYFDNGELGYQWLPNNASTGALFIRPNTERAYFSFWHPSNLLFSPLVIADGNTNNGQLLEESQYISLEDIDERKWSVDVGARFAWYQAQNTWSITLLNDLLSVHNGYAIEARYQRDMKWKAWSVAAQFSIFYKSQQLINYYYGIDDRDTDNSELWYEASHDLQFSVGLVMSKPLSANWQLLSRLHVTALGSGMTDSPLVNKNQVVNVFIGIGYRF